MKALLLVLLLSFSFAQPLPSPPPPGGVPGQPTPDQDEILKNLVLTFPESEAAAAIVAQIDAATTHVYLLAPSIAEVGVKDALLRAFSRGVDTAYIIEAAAVSSLSIDLAAAGVPGRGLPSAPEYSLLLVDNRYLTVGTSLAGIPGELQIVDLGTGADSVLYALTAAFQYGKPLE